MKAINLPTIVTEGNKCVVEVERSQERTRMLKLATEWVAQAKKHLAEATFDIKTYQDNVTEQVHRLNLFTNVIALNAMEGRTTNTKYPTPRDLQWHLNTNICVLEDILYSPSEEGEKLDSKLSHLFMCMYKWGLTEILVDKERVNPQLVKPLENLGITITYGTVPTIEETTTTGGGNYKGGGHGIGSDWTLSDYL